MATVKRPRAGHRTNPKRARHFSERASLEGNLHATEDPVRVKQIVFTRKERRKEERKLKKARKDAFIRRKELPTLASQLAARQKAYEEKLLRTEKLKEKRAKRMEKKRLREEQEREQEARKRAYFDAQKDDEREIKKMEKLLHLNKRKNKSTLPRVFAAEGLDYILDAIDSKKLHAAVNAGSESADEDTDEEVMTEEDAEQDTDAESSGDGAGNKVLKSVDDDDAGNVDDGSITDDVVNDNNDAMECQEVDNEDVTSSTDSDKTDDEVGDDDATDDERDDDGDANDDEAGSSEALDDDDNSGGEAGNGALWQKQVTGRREHRKSVLHSEAYQEDIYGRLRDANGNIMQQAASGASGSSAYVPPAKRLEMAAAAANSSSGSKKLELSRLIKQLKGLLNRLSEGNMQTICSQIENLYGHHSRADVTASLASLVNDACLSELRTPERLSTEMAMMVAVLHSNVGNEVGAEFVEMLARRYKELLDQGCGESKEIDNIVAFLCSLYNFQVIHGGLLLDIVNCLVERFGEKEIELILLAVKGCGFSLRKDEPVALKEVLKTINVKANTVDTSHFEDRSRVGFMLEVLAAIKNNNIRKIPNYDPSAIEHQKKLLRSFCRNSSPLDGQLRVSLADLLGAEARGKWWLVGSAWQGGKDAGHAGKEVMAMSLESSGDARVLKLARKQRMNTDVRRSVFCIIMTSEDYIDAYEKLLKLGLKNQPEREIIHVAVDCCMQEKAYNAYYSHLVQKFLELDRRFQMTFQFNLWDKFKVLNSTASFSIMNLASMVVHLLSMQVMSLSLLKAIEFGAMDKGTLRFTRAVLTGLLEKDAATVKTTFSRIAAFPKLRMLREGLKIFMQHFLLQGSKAKTDLEDSALAEKVAMAEMALASPADAMYF